MKIQTVAIMEKSSKDISNTQINNCIHVWFEKQVEYTPDRVAVVLGEQHITYNQLNQRANQLAHYLQKLRVEPEMPVGICVERSLEMIVGLLGILKAGGAYVPLDPKYPRSRLALILSDTDLSLVLTDQHLVNELFEDDSRVVCLDTNWHLIATQSLENPVSRVRSQHLAYVMYTSGSTGKPKGVQITHSNVGHYLHSINKVLEIQTDDVYLHTASFSFSSSVRQLILPLSQGSKIILANYEQTRNPLLLFELIVNQQVTVFDTVQSVWHHGLQALENSDQAFAKELVNSNLRLLVFSGGLLPCQLLKRVRTQVGNIVRLVNVYGQTETVGVCAYPIPVEFDREEGYVPVGYSIEHTQVHILDSNLQPVLADDKGELHVAGPSLARGYLNCPDLTSEQFIANPFSNDSSTRLYKTGDVARYLSDGTIEILGRLNHQVKIREMRIELGEIELQLEQHPSVRQTVVIAKDVLSGDVSLIAYIVPKLLSDGSTQTVSITELRSFLKQKLPEYMVPSLFVFLTHLPLTPNGKLDRSALPSPESVTSVRQSNFVAPGNELERQLVAIWEEVLGIQPIGIKDNFFDLGGHSLLAVRLFAQIERKLLRKLPLNLLLQSGTVEALAHTIKQQELAVDLQGELTDLADNQSNNYWSSVVPIQQKGSKPPLFCIHPLGGGVLVYRNLAMYLGPEQPVYGLEPVGLDGKQVPLTRIEDMASHYIQQIQLIQPVGPYYIAGYSFGGIVAFEMAQQLHNSGHTIGVLAMIDSVRPGFCQRTPLPLRLFLHLKEVFKNGPAYLAQKTPGWIKHSNYYLSQIYRRYFHAADYILNMTNVLSENHQLFIRVMEANLEAQQKYVFQPYPGQITLLRTEEDARDDAVGVQYDPYFGWKDLTSAGLDIYFIPGSHLSIIEEPHVQVLAQKLKHCLDRYLCKIN